MLFGRCSIKYEKRLNSTIQIFVLEEVGECQKLLFILSELK